MSSGISIQLSRSCSHECHQLQSVNSFPYSLDACRAVDPLDILEEDVTDDMTDDSHDTTTESSIGDSVEDTSDAQTDEEDVPSTSAASGTGQSSTGWVTRFAVPVQPPLITAKLRDGGDTLKSSELGMFLESVYTAISKDHGVL